MEITVENLERAVSQFYHTDSQLQGQAHQWLTAVQSSTNAWAIVWELLQPTRSGEAQFFGATTLHTKLMKNWSEVPQEQYGFLKNKLLETILQYSSGPKIVLNRLCISLSAYLIQTTPYFWENSVEDLMNMFRPEALPNVPPEKSLWILLEVLTVIPEEFHTMNMSQTHKSSVRQELEKVAPRVITLLENVLDCCDSELQSEAIKTTNAWLAFGVPLPSCVSLAHKLANAIRNQAMQGLDGEIECSTLSLIGTHPGTHRFPNTVLQIMDILLPLAELTQDMENKELVANVYKLLIDFAECQIKVLLKELTSLRDGGERSCDSVKRLIRVAVQCTIGPGLYPTQEVHSQLTTAFWYMLQDELMRLPKEGVKEAREVLVPIYQEVSEVLLVKSQYPPTGEPPLTAADAELFRCYRQDIADTMIYCYYMVREYMVKMLKERMDNAKSWQEVEAVIHVAFAIAETTSMDDNSKMVQLLAKLPPHLVNCRVINTHNQAVGAYAEYLSSDGEAVGILMPGVLSALQSPETAMTASMALKDITRECYTTLKPYAQHLLSACQEALNKGHLRQAECVRIMFSVGKLLSILPYDTMCQMIHPLIHNYTSNIEHLLAQEPSAQVKAGLKLRLKMIGAMCNTLYLDGSMVADPPTLFVMKQLLPVLVQVIGKWSHDPTIIEEVCICLKNGVTSLPENCEALLESILSIVVSCYSAQPNTPALDLVRMILVQHGPSRVEMCGLLLNSIVSTTLNVASQQANPSDASDLLHGFHGLLSAIVKRNTHILVHYVDSGHLFRFATMTLLLQEVATVKNAGSFLCNLITQSREVPQLTSVVQDNGEQLVHTCIRCIGGDSLRSTLDVFSELLLCLNKKYCDSLSRWLASVLSQEGFPSPQASVALKSKFTSMVLRERANKRKLQDTVREFALICRGVITTDLNVVTQTI